METQQTKKSARYTNQIFIVAMSLVIIAFSVFVGYIFGKPTPDNKHEDTGHNHSAVHNADTQNLKQQVDTHQVEINKTRFSLSNLIDGSELITFQVSPSFVYQEAECFLIHNESKLYIRGLVKPGQENEILCSPLGDQQLPFEGYFYVYLRIKSDTDTLVTKFDIDIL